MGGKSANTDITDSSILLLLAYRIDNTGTGNLCVTLTFPMTTLQAAHTTPSVFAS